MSLLTPTEIKRLCAEYSLTPSKKYGQNYLISELPVQKMIEAAQIKPGDAVYEIGPGFGILTFELLKAGAIVRAFEIEQKLKSYWEAHMVEYPGLEIVWGNVLRQWNEYIQNELRPYKVIANLPYQITSEVLETILESTNQPTQVICMVQKEVAERIVARPGDMSILAVSIQYFGVPKIVAKVSRGSFWPSPKVDSAVLSITNIQSRGESVDFFRLVKAGFHHRRKKLLNNIVEAYNISKIEVEDIFEKLNLNKNIRAEELSIEEWEKFSKLLTR
ncbi:MAG TPA: 16S rRNA (adenine(1518)-N(6)/adenine(1519)-N(6))-dimethyltransferase RsmA [Candidatus Magasanikbacteria bacterium]|nr:16S rRNA (adenine(1518)-N(6)/adenine(1519)-N(6))-dimethyltransferase RsmA [Candidatus Magasanikbacteria bacterium]